MLQRGMIVPAPPEYAFFPPGKYFGPPLTAAEAARGSQANEPQECANDQSGEIEYEWRVHP